MTQTNMTTFSDAMNAKLSVSDDVCPIHNRKLIYLAQSPERKPICYECAKEVVEQQNKEMAENASQHYLEHTTKKWLNRHSIYLDETLKKATFDSFKTDDLETEQNKEMALQIAREYYKGATYNTIFTGKAGSGKSHLARAMLEVVNNYSDPYRKCLFVSVDELMRRIKDSFNNKQSFYTEQRMVDLLTEADLLVLDDLGAETGAIETGNAATDFTTRTLYAVINGRMNKPTILTTNLNSQGMLSMYDSKLVSRMFRGADGHVIKFEKTKDKRRTLEF